MIAYAVTAQTGQTLAVFRSEQDADDFLAERADRPEPIFRAVAIRRIVLDEGIWDASHRPHCPTPYLQHHWEAQP